MEKKRTLGNDRPVWEQILRPILIVVIIAGIWFLLNASKFL